MDPLSIIVTALVMGAAAGLEPTAAQAVKDAYAGIKRLIQDRYERVSVDMLENDPKNETRQEIVKEDLLREGAGNDVALLEQAQAVLEAVKNDAPVTARDISILFKDVEGKSFTIDDVIAAGKIAIEVGKGKFEGNVKVSGLRTNEPGESSPNP